MRADDAVLVEQGQTAGHFEHALDHKHHVGASGVVFVEHQSDVVLDGPGQDAVAEFSDLLAVTQDDGVLADKIDARNVAVEVDADQRPVETRCDLLDMGRFARAVIALNHDAAVEGETGENGKGGVAIEQVVRVDLGHVVGAVFIALDHHVAVDPEQIAH